MYKDVFIKKGYLPFRQHSSGLLSGCDPSHPGGLDDRHDAGHSRDGRPCGAYGALRSTPRSVGRPGSVAGAGSSVASQSGFPAMIRTRVRIIAESAPAERVAVDRTARPRSVGLYRSGPPTRTLPRRSNSCASAASADRGITVGAIRLRTARCTRASSRGLQRSSSHETLRGISPQRVGDRFQ